VARCSRVSAYPSPAISLERIRLQRELRRWRAAGRQAYLWWRDDDAREVTPALRRLLAVAEKWHVPLTLAVIPDGDTLSLRSVLEGRSVEVIQHGVDHCNRLEGVGAGEFPPSWSRLRVTTQLRAGWARLRVLPDALPVFVPPWHDVHPQLPASLRDCDFLGWSAWAGLEHNNALPRIDTHIDLLRWRGGARFRGQSLILKALRNFLMERRRSGDWDTPIGLLTHHLVHDAAAWHYLDQFLSWTCIEPVIVWTSLSSLLNASGMPSITSPHAKALTG
jgi:hypothetical protein